MPQTPDAPKLCLTLANRGRLPAAEAVAIFRQLLAQVKDLHAVGRIHRDIRAENIVVAPDGSARLEDAAPVVEFRGHDADRETCPPEVQLRAPLLLPADAAAAGKLLAEAGIAIAPQRFDIYQLGALLLQMTTGQTVEAFLRSPRAKSQVPDGLLPMITGALGFAAAERISDVSTLAAALPSSIADTAETPPRGSAVAVSPAASEHDTPLPDAAQAAPRLSPPLEQLGHYRILSRIGQGGMGDVYLGFEEELQRHVAIKVLPVELARSEELVRRFLAEASAVARIAHPHVVPIHFIGHDADRHFYAMQYVEGESLDRLLARQRQLPVTQTLAIIEQCLAGLQAVHQAGLIHRDIKPANILIDAKTQRALVADFGLVKAGADGPTATGVVLGTVDYMAPEVARGHKADARCDLYAVGVMAYQMLSGRLPFAAETPTAVLFQHAYETPPPLRAVVPGVSNRVADFVDKLLAKEPDDRYADSAEALAALRRCRTETDTESYTAVKPVESVIALSDFGFSDIPQAQPWWQQLRARIISPFSGKRVPEWQASVTVQDVDHAVAEYAARRNRLAALLADAQRAVQVLAAPSFASTTDSDASLATGKTVTELQADIDTLRSQLAETDATLARLRGQRDLLKARLRATSLDGAHGAFGRRFSRPAQPVLIGIAAVIVAAVGFAVLPNIFRRQAPDVSATGSTTQPPSSPIESTVQQQKPVPPPVPVVVLPSSDVIDAWNRAGIQFSGPVQGLASFRVASSPAATFHGLPSPEVPFSLTFSPENLPETGFQELAGLKHLHGLRVYNPKKIAVNLQGLSNLKELRRLNLDYTPVTDADMRALAGMVHLQDLTLDFTKVTDAGLEALTDLPQLQTLSLRESAVTDEGIKKLVGLSQLQSLGLWGTGVTGAAFKELSLPLLTTLDIQRTQVDDEGMKGVAALTGLQTLHVNSTKVSDKGLKELAKLKDLQFLSLSNTTPFSGVTDAGLKELAGLTRMRTLHLDGTAVTDAGLKHLAGMKQLETLTLSSKVTDAGLQDLTGLTELRWLGIPYLTDDGLKQLVGMKYFQKLDRLFLAKVTDKGLNELSKLPNLRTLHLTGREVTNAGLMELANLRTLETLMLGKATTKVDSDGIAEFKSKSPSVQVTWQ